MSARSLLALVMYILLDASAGGIKVFMVCWQEGWVSGGRVDVPGRSREHTQAATAAIEVLINNSSLVVVMTLVVPLRLPYTLAVVLRVCQEFVHLVVVSNKRGRPHPSLE